MLLLTIFKQWPASAHRYTSHLTNKLLIAHQISADDNEHSMSWKVFLGTFGVLLQGTTRIPLEGFS